jgi:hypothetical protein
MRLGNLRVSHFVFVYEPPITFIVLMYIPYYVRIVSIFDITENILQMNTEEAIF